MKKKIPCDYHKAQGEFDENCVHCVGFTKEQKLSILEQLIDDGEVDAMDTIEQLIKEKEKLVEALKDLIFYTSNDGVPWTLLSDRIKKAQQALKEYE